MTEHTATIQCASCGRQNRGEAAYCDGCGKALTPSCPQCGALVRPTGRFCDSCGALIQRAGAAAISLQTPEHLAQKIRSARDIEGERRNVTVLFADTQGYTSLSEHLDAEHVYALMQKCIDCMVTCVHDQEGTVTQFLGDGIMAVFGAPIAHEDSAHRAVSASLDMQRELAGLVANEERLSTSSISFRVGLNTGPVVVGRISDDLSMDYTAIGDTVNLAARMEEMCEPGGVYVTEATHRQVADYFDWHDAGVVQVKGRAETVHVYRAMNVRSVRTRMEAAVARGLSPFMGRERELTMLEGFWSEALQGRGQIVLVSGEPGIGKSRLLLELRRTLGPEVIWREAQCVPYGADIPYLPVVDLVKSGFGIAEEDDEGAIIDKVDRDTADWTPQGQKRVPYLKYLLQVDPGDPAIEGQDPMERRAGILDSLRALILERSRDAPRVVVVEDLHWADSQSETAFRVCADAIAASPVLMIMTFRPGYMHPSADLPHAHRIALKDLDGEARRGLASATLQAASLSAELADSVIHKTEGNPLFIEEVAKALGSGFADSEAVPDSLQGVILARIDRLEATAKEALQLASVIGREFTLRLLSRISDLHVELEGVLGELKALELIYEKVFFPELAYMFKHALTHDVAYSTLLVERRKALHRVVAIAIEELYFDRIGEHYETLAHHYFKAEVWDKALQYLRMSAEKAAGAYSNDQAIEFYRRAIEVAAKLGDRKTQIELSRSRGLLCIGMGESSQAVLDFDRMAEAAEASGDGHARAWGLALRGYALFWDHQHERSLEALSTADAAAQQGYDDVRLFSNMCLAEAHFAYGPMSAGQPHLQLAQELLERVDEPLSRVMWGWVKGIERNWVGYFDEALDHLDRWGTSEKIDQLGDLVFTDWTNVLALGGAGRYNQALELVGEVLNTCERVGETLVYARALNTVGWVRVELEDHDSAMEWNARSYELAESINAPDPEVQCHALLNWGDSLLALGRLDEAADRLGRVEAVVRNPRPQDRFALWLYSQHLFHSTGRLCLLRGDPEGALRYADECLALAEPAPRLKNIVKGRRLRGESLIALGELGEAEKDLRSALKVAREIGNPPQLWKSFVALAELRLSQGRSAEALGAYKEALSVIESVAAPLADERLRAVFLGSSHVQDIQRGAGMA